ncbi:MAG: ABC transporter substrate-binding protein [Bradymonadia bacterium]|jgi:branched-chain amino acid transport system substrate-binding protein
MRETTRRQLLGVLSTWTLVGLALVGCDKMRGGGGGEAPGSKPASGAPASAAAPQTGNILIGEYGSMTGSEATFGQSTHNGIVLAVEEVNAAGGIGGRKVELKNYDTQGKSQEAGTVVTRLITEDKVVAVLGEVASSLSLAGGRVAQQFGVPMITPSSTNPQVTQIGDMVFRVCFIDPYQGYVIAKFASENLKHTKVAILYDQAQAYSKGLKDDFRKAFEAVGGQVVTEQAYSGGDQDFSAQLGNIKAAAPEAIFVPGYYTDVGNIALQARKLGLTATLLGGDGWDSPKLAEIGGAAIENSYFSNHYSHEEQRPEVQGFVQKYQAKYNVVPDGLAAMGYDAARLLFDAMKRAPSLGGKDLAAAIAQTRDFPGVTGKITIDADRNARKPAVVLQVKGGKYAFAASIQPQQ